MQESSGGSRSSEDLDLLAYFAVLWKRRVLIAGLFAAAVAGALVHGLVSPKIYTSTATIITPKEGAASGLNAALMVSALSAKAIPGLPFSSTTPNRDLFLGILKSDAAAKAIIEDFRLRERYRCELVAEALEILRSRTSISVNNDGLIAIKVEETDPQLAADLANDYVQKLDRTLTSFEATEASKQRGFIERRIGSTKEDLRRAEESLRRFQEEHKAFALQEQAKGLVDEVARLKGQIIAEEVLLEGLRTTAAEQSPEVQRMKRRIEAMKQHLEKQFGEALNLTAEKKADEPGEFRILPFKDFPELGLELARLTRDVKVQETVFTLLTQQLEEAKIAEARDMPRVQVIDPAYPAERKSRPKIRANMVVAGCASLFFGVLLAFVLEHVESLKRKLARRRGLSGAAVAPEAPASAPVDADLARQAEPADASARAAAVEDRFEAKKSRTKRRPQITSN
jgi:uncharacterized protein involved in exopolysaccharide biosynthesis